MRMNTSSSTLSRFLPFLLLTIFFTMVRSNDNNCNPEEGTCQLYPILGKPDEFTDSSTVGIKLAVRRWTPPPEEETKSVVLFCHGGAGFHTGYSDIMGKALSQAGIAVIAYDQAGSGYSDGPRNIFDSIETVTADYTKMLKMVRKEYPDKQVFAMGESFGGFIILVQAVEEQRRLDEGNEGTLADGYILTGPVVKLLPEMLPPKPVLYILKFLANFFPMLNMPGTDFFSTFDLAFGDKAWAQTGRNDPIIQEAAEASPKLGMVCSVLSTMDSLQRSFASVKVPLKILVGELEGRVDVNAIKALAEEATSKDKDLEFIPGAYHQLFQDVPKVTQQVCERVTSWILARSKN